MMPPPEEVAAFVDRAEDYAMRGEWRLAHKTREDRRRLLAWGVFEYLRHDWDGAYAPELVPVSGR